MVDVRGGIRIVALLSAIACLCGLRARAGADDAPAEPQWVFFVDRGPGSAPARAVDAAVAAAPDTAPATAPGAILDPAQALRIARAYPPATWARRAQAGITPLPDLHDLPVHEPYVREVAELGRLRCRSRWLNAVSVELTPDARERAARLPFVAAVRPVAAFAPAGLGPLVDEAGEPLERVIAGERRPARPDLPARGFAPVWTSGLSYGPSYGQLHEIAVPPVHGLGYSGNGVRLMMIDTGFFKDHDAFHYAHILAEWDFVFGDGETQNEAGDWPWQHGHGTGTWSVAGGFAPGTLVGPAFGATFLLAKTENPLSETRVEEDYYVAALEWGDSLGVNVTSASLNYICFDGGFCYQTADRNGDTAVITIALDIAAARGILCVNSLGNYGCAARTTLGTPADADSMLAVGAVDSFNVIAPFSACGPTYDGRTKPEVVARGVHDYMAGASATDTYGPGSGTSFSTPLVAGAAALLMEAHPEWSAMQVRRALMETADRAGSPGDRYGWGRINTAAALSRTAVCYPRPFSLIGPAEAAPPSDPRPVLTWHASVDPDGSAPLAYTLEIREASTTPDEPGAGSFAFPAEGWSIAAGADTALTLPFALAPASAYRWRVIAEDEAGNRRASREEFTLRIGAGSAGVDGPESAAPASLHLLPEANPFRGALRVRIEAAAPLADPPAWAIYDAAGRRIAGGRAAGAGASFSAAWDGTDARGTAAFPGIYYLEVRAGARVARETLVRLGD
jgi:subtilisin family serine protease